MSPSILRAVAFHPSQCPTCIHYVPSNLICLAYAGTGGPRMITTEMNPLAAGLCAEYRQTGASQEPAAPLKDAAQPIPVTGVEKPAMEPQPEPVPPPVGPAPSLSDTQPNLTKMQAARPSPLPMEPRIQCPKCKHENLPIADRCEQCDAELLPGEDAATRIGGFIGGVGFAALLGYLLYRFFIVENSSPPDLACLNPIVLGGGAIFSFFTGIVLLVRKTPVYLRYSIRSEKHLNFNPLQALNDINQAIVIAPENKRSELIKQRTKVFDKLGRADDAARDRLKLALAPDAFKNEANWVSMITNGDADAYTVGRRSGQISSILKSGTAKAVGYCPKCDMAVELTVDQRCPVHPNVKGREVEYVIPADLRDGQLAVMEKMEKHSPRIHALLGSMIASGEVKAVGYCRKCRAVIDLDSRQHCRLHPKSKVLMVKYAYPGGEAEPRQEIQKNMKSVEISGGRRWITLISLVIVVLTILYLIPEVRQFVNALFS